MCCCCVLPIIDLYLTIRMEWESQATQNGQLGIAFDVMWFEPMSNTTIDIEAAKRAQEFQLGW